MYFLSQLNLFWYTKNVLIDIPKMATGLRLGRGATSPMLATGGMTQFTSPAVSPAYLGVGYIIGPRLASLNFAGGVVAWGLLVPLLIYFLGPTLPAMPAGASPAAYWGGIAFSVWYSIVRPIAVGGMLVGAGFTLFRMRKQLLAGMKRAVSDLKKSAEAHQGHQPYRPRPECESRFPGRGTGVPRDDRAVLLLHRRSAQLERKQGCRRRGGGGRGHDRAGILLRRGFRQSGRHDRVVQQSSLRTDAVHPGGCGAADGGAGSLGRRRRGGGAWESQPWSAYRPQSRARCCRI